MNKNIILSLLAAMAVAPAMAQETYESAQIATEDLNGTAKYVGMGGAMEALGADISTIGTNPAGIGMFRKSWAGISFGVTSQPEQEALAGSNRSNADFGQAGFVFSNRISKKSYINVGFNYHKSRNFNQILAASSALSGASQNKLSYMKGYIGDQTQGGFDPDKDSYSGTYLGYQNATSNDVASTFSQVDYLYWNALIPDASGIWGYNEASGYNFERRTSGYIGEYDINISGNSNNRLYWGLTVGIKDVHYNSQTIYTESLVDANNAAIGDVTMNDNRYITGQGYDVKLGVIYLPFEGSPFRIGANIATPTWYELTSENNTTLYNNCSQGLYDNGYSTESYTYKMFTPWKFGLSLGHTVGKVLALGASYEFADYSTLSNRYITEEGHDGMPSQSEKDIDMNDNTSRSLDGVHTLKLGLEYKVVPNFAVRVGYNYVSPMYKSTGFRNGGVTSDGTYYSSTTDYTNWKSTNRFTCGVGFTNGHFSADLAYQYAATNGVFHAFQDLTVYDNSTNNTIRNICSVSSVKDQRHQFILTLGYRF